MKLRNLTVASLAFLALLAFLSLTSSHSAWGGAVSAKLENAESPRAERPSEKSVPTLASSTGREHRQSVTLALDATLENQESGAISGTVFGPEGQTLSGIECSLLRGRSPSGMDALFYRAPVPAEIATTTTTSGSDGTFSLPAASGFWTLRVECEGMAPWEEEFLKQGDARMVRLSPALDLSVRVVDSNDDGIESARVALLRGRYHDPRSAVVSESTGADGAGTLKAVPAGSWFMHVSHADHFASVRRVSTQHAASGELEVRLRKGVRIRGSVTRGDGRALAESARVRFESAEGMISSHEVVCDFHGHYNSRTAFHPELTVEVVALVEGFGEVRKRVSFAEGASEAEINLVVDAVDRAAIGTVLGPNGEALSGAEIYVVPLESLPKEQAIHVPSAAELAQNGNPDFAANDPIHSGYSLLRLAATTEADGTFRVSGLRAEMAYKLLVAAEPYSNGLVWVETGQAGENRDLGVIHLRRGGRVHGWIGSPDGEPLKDELVSVIENKFIQVIPDSEFFQERPSAQTGGLDATSSAGGYFSIEALPEANFMLSSGGQQFGPFEIKEGETLGPLELIVGEPQQRNAATEKRLQLKVLDELGDPVPQAFVSLRKLGDDGERHVLLQHSDTRYVRGDEFGVAEFKTQAGTFEAVVMDLTGRLENTTVQLELDVARGSVSREIRLALAAQPMPDLNGTVISTSGSQVGGLLVALIPDKSHVPCSCVKLWAYTDDSGEFNFGPVMKGAHRLVVTSHSTGDTGVQFSPARSGESILVPLD